MVEGFNALVSNRSNWAWSSAIERPNATPLLSPLVLTRQFVFIIVQKKKKGKKKQSPF
jgi:hypothetical protein